MNSFIPEYKLQAIVCSKYWQYFVMQCALLTFAEQQSRAAVTRVQLMVAAAGRLRAMTSAPDTDTLVARVAETSAALSSLRDTYRQRSRGEGEVEGEARAVRRSLEVSVLQLWY